MRQKNSHCTECDKSFYSKTDLDRHYQSVHSTERPFVCEVCSSSFKTKPNLGRHVKNAHDKIKNGCLECKTYYKTEYELDEHLTQIHPNFSRFICQIEVCQKGFLKEVDLKIHYAKNHETFPKTCSLCKESKTYKEFQKSSGSSDDLKSHCSQCRQNEGAGRSFTLDGHIQRLFDGAKASAIFRVSKGRVNVGLVDISLEFLLGTYKTQLGMCYYSGLTMELGISIPWKMSLERLDVNEGYLTTNCVLVCNEFNGACQ